MEANTCHRQRQCSLLWCPGKGDFCKSLQSQWQIKGCCLSCWQVVKGNSLYKSSSASRLHVYDIATDISFGEAVTYLKCMCPQTSAEVVTDMVKLVGGRFVHLRVASFELA